MMSRNHWIGTLASLATLFAIAIGPSTADAADWPQYRGPQRDGHGVGENLLPSWGDTGPRERWRVTIGDDGYSSLAVVGGRIYTLVGNAGAEFAVAHDAATGARLWQTVLDKDRSDGQGGGPRATPTVVGDTVIVAGASGRLAALDASNGDTRWTVDLVEEHGAKAPQWGFSGSPLVVGELVLVELGGKAGRSLAAFDLATGELRWFSESDTSGYSSPLAVEVAGVHQVLFFTGAGLVSVSPTTGSLYWRVPWATSYDVNAAMPVFVPPDKVFISSAYDTGGALYQIRADGDRLAATEVWRSKAMRNHFNSSVLVADHLYGFDNGTLKCVHAQTGTERWAQRGFAKGSLIFADGHLVVLGEKGQLALIEATPDAYREQGRAQLFTSRTWAQPALADGVLYVRSQKEMVALEIGR